MWATEPGRLDHRMTHRQLRPDQTRRLFLGGALLLLGGCATGGGTASRVARLPGPIWDPSPALPTPDPPRKSVTSGGYRARSAWAGGAPNPRRMSTMAPIRRITMHHDGMSAFTDTTMSAASQRLESIRRAHLKRRPQPFGDIGYHFAIDPAGRIWECRPLQYQGAHVRAHNEGNMGIVVLGNYDKQGLNAAQQRAIISFLQGQMRTRGIRSSAVTTHQELASTACPGRSLQAFMVSARQGRLG